jgi:formate hydrogenlyase subunit 4
MSPLILLFFQAITVVLLAPIAVGIVKKCKAFFQGRHGASIFLPYTSLFTLWKKETIVSETASWVYRIVPPLVFVIALGIAFMLPLLVSVPSESVFLSGTGSLFFIAGLFLLSAVLMVLAGLDTGGAFGGMASSREMSIASLLEPAMLLTFTALALHMKGLPVDTLSLLPAWSFLSPAVLLAIIALVFIALAENARFPVDNPATHLELTMVHEGMILEYSGRHLALLEWASAIKLAVFAIFILNLFAPWTLITTTSGLLSISGSFIILKVFIAAVCKIAIMMFLLGLLESSIAKMRFYRMQEYLSWATLFGFAAVIATFIA